MKYGAGHSAFSQYFKRSSNSIRCARQSSNGVAGGRGPGTPSGVAAAAGFSCTREKYSSLNINQRRVRLSFIRQAERIASLSRTISRSGIPHGWVKSLKVIPSHSNVRSNRAIDLSLSCRLAKAVKNALALDAVTFARDLLVVILLDTFFAVTSAAQSIAFA